MNAIYRAAIAKADIAAKVAAAEPRFETSAGQFPLSDLLSANAEDAALCDWMRSAAIGDLFGGGAGESIARIS